MKRLPQDPRVGDIFRRGKNTITVTAVTDTRIRYRVDGPEVAKTESEATVSGWPTLVPSFDGWAFEPVEGA